MRKIKRGKRERKPGIKNTMLVWSESARKKQLLNKHGLIKKRSKKQILKRGKLRLMNNTDYIVNRKKS